MAPIELRELEGAASAGNLSAEQAARLAEYNPSVPMVKLDVLILGALAENAFTPRPVKGMLQKLKEGLSVANTKGRRSRPP
ncbi:MAG: hypothetical protein OEW21_19020 [Betaproteobacteria bacterium]|nr:hypothetical protein [Betaproteobacteria bacterium]